MFQKLKENTLKKNLKKLVLQNQQTDISSTKKIQTIGIITSQEISSKINLVPEIERILDIKNVKIYSLRNFNKKDTLSDLHFTEKDIYWNGQFKPTNFKSFLEEPFHLLIGYFSANNIILETAIAQSKADLKVGFTNVNEDLYSIEISEETENIASFLSELKKYLQILKKL